MRVPVIDLVDQPGETRPLNRRVGRDEVGSDAPWGPAEDAFDGPLDLDLRLESLVDGVLVRGTVSFVLELSCARCLVPLREEREAQVAELYRDPVAHPEETERGYEIEPDLHIDLETMLRDLVVLGFPVRVLCSDDCAGLCPACGQDRNQRACGHDASPGIDPRWAPLLDLEVPSSR